MQWTGLVRARLPEGGSRVGFYAEGRKHYHFLCFTETGVRVMTFKQPLRTELLVQSPKDAAAKLLADEYNIGVTEQARRILEEILDATVPPPADAAADRAEAD